MAEMNSYREDILQVFEADLPWEIFSGTNILITGATGLIGGTLVDVLMSNPRRDYCVYASGRNVKRAKERFGNYFGSESFHFVQYDVMSPLEGDKTFDYIIHAASNASPNAFFQSPVEIIKSNIYGVSNLMDYGISHGMKRFLYVSSGEVYGEGDGRVFDEEYSGYVDSMKARSCYPSSKRASETLCASYASEYGADVVIVRPCHIYGPHFTESDNRVYAQFVRNVLNGEDIVMRSTGEQFRSWCYAVDCVSALLYVLLKGVSGEAYNIADPASIFSIRQLAEMLAEIGHSKVVMEVASEMEKKGYNPVQKSVFSVDKLKYLGWKVSGSMMEKMAKTVNYLKENSK
jgi:nucleoside-diphosphate-sugar epimerase